jgi:hypothetical protein
VDELDASITTEVIRLHRLVPVIAAARREGERPFGQGTFALSDSIFKTAIRTGNRLVRSGVVSMSRSDEVGRGRNEALWQPAPCRLNATSGRRLPLARQHLEFGNWSGRFEGGELCLSSCVGDLGLGTLIDDELLGRRMRSSRITSDSYLHFRLITIRPHKSGSRSQLPP